MFLTFVAIIFLFSLLVIIHELGHFLAAKWMGVRVEKFSIGFPPTLYTKKIGETDFCISAIPLGGFVKMSGFIDESMDDKSTGADYEFNAKPVWKRTVIITAGVIMNLFLAIAILTTINFTQGESIYPTTTIGRTGEDGIAEKIGFQRYDKIVAMNGREIDNWNELNASFIDNLNQNITFEVMRDNRVVELQYKKEWFGGEGAEFLDIEPLLYSKVGLVKQDMPANETGLQTGDKIVSLDDRPIEYWDEMTEIIRAHPDETISIEWQRDSQVYSGTITPEPVEETNAEGETKVVGKIGVGVYYEHNEINFLQAIPKGIADTYNLLALNIRGLWWVLSGAKSAKEVIGGPIMIAEIAGDAAKAGWIQYWYVVAALSAMLAFFNILPIPALDGGHLFFILLEGVMGRPLQNKTRIKIQQIGMAILLTLIIFIFYIDISRIFQRLF